MMTWMSDPQAWIALLTLTALEIVLGIDNIIFLTILVGRLPPKDRPLGRILGLGFALATRILLLFSLVWLTHLTNPLFTVMNKTFSARDLILFIGGLFLIAKSTHEIHNSMEEEKPTEQNVMPGKSNLLGIIVQIGLIDIVFSLDSVITAIGMANNVSVMVIAVVISIFVMMFSAKSIGEFVDEHPTIKMLALSFLILIGVALVGEGMNFHIPKGYIYFAMAFSVIVEMLNIRIRKRLRG
ncbi:MAG TPA: TerC family protein [Candidatus Berkiella sp.]|nr:TerC family protein [Candidatus Berkiella sp.]